MPAAAAGIRCLSGLRCQRRYCALCLAHSAHGICKSLTGKFGAPTGPLLLYRSLQVSLYNSTKLLSTKKSKPLLLGRRRFLATASPAARQHRQANDRVVVLSMQQGVWAAGDAGVL
jgi:hypothetical protein